MPSTFVAVLWYLTIVLTCAVSAAVTTLQTLPST
jgi:hypothetical protein